MCGKLPLDSPQHIITSHYVDLTIIPQGEMFCSLVSPIYFEDRLLFFFLRCDHLKSSVYLGLHQHVFWGMMLPEDSGHSLSPYFAIY